MIENGWTFFYKLQLCGRVKKILAQLQEDDFIQRNGLEVRRGEKGISFAPLLKAGRGGNAKSCQCYLFAALGPQAFACLRVTQGLDKNTDS